MPINSPTGFLDITNATLRTSNLEAQNLLITGGNIYVTSELEADATVLNLENVTRKGNVSSNTIEITNATTGIVATGNIHALKFIGSGAGLTSIPSSAISGTLSQWSDGANSDVYIASNVGIGNVHTLTSNTLQVGGNLYVRDTDANVLTVNGNVVASYFEGDGSKLSGIVTDLQGVTDNGNVTTNVVQFSNVTTGLVTTANIEVGGDIKVVGLSAGTVPYVASDKFLKDSFITMTGDATVITSNLDVTGNIFMRGKKFIVESETKLINDAIIGIANNNTVSTTDKGIIMQNTTGNVAIIHHGAGDGFADQLTFGYTADPLDTVTVTNDLTKELTVNVLGNVITQNNLSVGGTLSINTISAASSHSLQAVTNLGNVTSNTVQFSNAITSLVASSNIVATGNVSAGRNTDTTSYFGRAAVGYMGTSDQASFAHFDRNSSAQYALKQTAAGPTYINTPTSGHIRFTVNDGNAGAEKMRITSAGNVGIGVSAPHANLHVEGNVYVSSNLTVSGNATVSENLTVSGSILGYATKISVTSPSGTESSFAYGSENYKLHTFTSNGTFTVTASGIVEYLIVAGGGGGGYGHTGGGGHGGGGGGGVLTGTMWVPVGNHAVTVGGGGAGDSSGSSGNGANGGNSTFLHQIAIGGGGGHGWANTPLTGNSGGCGGGGGGVSTGTGGRVGGYGTMNQGCNGGDGHYDDGSNNNHSGHRGGGGGGAGTPGRSWNINLHKNNWKAFEGGDGRACSITGSQVYYGGGGGGSGIVSSYLYAIVTASGGLGGGGNGGITNSGSNAGNTVGGNGTVNTGGGGGGGGYAKAGGAGGSGIVIIRYLS